MAVFGEAITPYIAVAPDGISAIDLIRFPVPRPAVGFLTLVDFEMMISRTNRRFAGALVAEGTHMEPTIGQIWPR